MKEFYFRKHHKYIHSMMLQLNIQAPEPTPVPMVVKVGHIYEAQDEKKDWHLVSFM